MGGTPHSRFSSCENRGDLPFPALHSLPSRPSHRKSEFWGKPAPTKPQTSGSDRQGEAEAAAAHTPQLHCTLSRKI